MLTLAAPFHRRLAAYLRERFPLGAYALLIAAFYSSNHFLALALTEPGAPPGYDLRSLAGAGILFCFFFHLRVFDEHKDYRDDCRHHPERVLQRGLVTLDHLRRLGAAAIAAELLLAAWLGPAALAALSLAFLFSVLMLKEFFVARWLRPRLLLYATTHMLVMPLLAATVFSITTRRPPWEAPGWFWLWAVVSVFVGFNWEISRKIRAPEEEREGVDTYSRRFGPFRAALLVLLVRVADTALVALVGRHLGLSPWFYAVLGLLFGVCLVGYFGFRLRPSPRTARRLETYASLYVVAFDLTLAGFLALEAL